MKKILILLLSAGIVSCGKPTERPVTAKKGELAPEISVPRFQRGDLKSVKGWGDLKGRAVVLEFWGTYCEPCIENMPHINGLSEKFKDKPVVFLSLSREPSATVEEFLKEHDLKGNVAADAGEVFRSFGVRGIPHTVLIDKDSRVQAFTYPSRVTEQTIEDLLAGKPLEGDKPAAEPAASAAGALASFSAGPSSGGQSMTLSDDEIKLGGLNLAYAIETAMRDTHGVEFKDVPKDLLQKKIDLVAKVDLGQDGSRLKLRNLIVSGLNGAFPLNISVVKKTKKVYLLKKAGTGKPGLTAFTGKGGSRRMGNDGKEAFMSAKGGFMPELADELEDWLGEPVLDETGFGDKQFNFELKFSPVNLKAANAALAAQLGLKLVEARRAVEITEVLGAKPADIN